MKQELDRQKYINESSGTGTQVDLYFVVEEYYRTQPRRDREQTRRGVKEMQIEIFMEELERSEVGQFDGGGYGGEGYEYEGY